MISNELFYNLTLIVALSAISGFISRRFKREVLSGKILQGVLFGVIAIVGIVYAYHLKGGINFDGRAIVISLGTLFFGPFAGAIITALSSIFRLWLGGIGTTIGIATIVSSYLIGLLFYYQINKKNETAFGWKQLLYMGVVVNVVNFLLLTLLPIKIYYGSYEAVGFTILVIFPLCTVLIGKILLDQQVNEQFSEILKERESLFRTTLYSIRDGVVTTDLQGKIVNMNFMAEKLTDWKENEAKGKSFEEVFVIKDIKNKIRIENSVERLLHDKEVAGFSEHFELVSKIGTSFPIAESGSLIKNDNGETIGCVFVFQDQTEDYKTKKIIEESEEKLRSLIKHSPVGIHIFEIDSNNEIILLDANEAADKILGIKHKVNFGKSVRNIFPAEMYSLISIVCKSINESGKTFKSESGFFESEVFSGYYDVFSFKISENRFASFFTDVSDRVAIENQLKENEAKHRILLDESNDPIFLFDEDGRYLYVNNAFAKGVEKSVEDIVNKKIWDVFDKEEAEKRFNALQTVINSGEEKVIEVRVPNSKGNLHYLTTITPIKNEDGRVVKVICSSKDITSRKKAEEQLAESEARIATFMNYIPALIVIKDSDFKTLYTNEAVKQFYNLDFIGKTPYEIFDKEIADEVVKYDKVALEEGSVLYESTWFDKNGKKRIFLDQKFRIDFANKKPMIGMIETDITDRRRSDDIQKIQYNIADAMIKTKKLEDIVLIIQKELGRLIDTENFFVAMLDETTGMLRSILEVDKNDNILEWPAKDSLTGYLILQNKTLLLHKNETDELENLGYIEKYGVDSESWLGVPLRINNKAVGALVVQNYENRNAYDEYSIAVIETIGNQLSAYIERKRTEDLLLESEDKFRSFAESSPFAIMIYQGNKWVYTNPAGELITGYTAEELYTQNYWDIATPEFKDIIKKRGVDRQSGSDGSGSYEFSIATKSGIVKWVYLTGRQITFLGKPAGFISVVDISDRKKMEEELREAKEKAEEMNRIKSFFFANMSHELRTPFMPIMGYAELLASILEDPDEKEMAEAILFSSRRLTETLKNVLDLTRLEFDKVDITVTKINIVHLLKEIFFLFKENAKKKNVELKISYNQEEIWCVTEEQILREILTNFVSNALKFTDVGYVEISALTINENDNDFVVLSVTDTGIGIPQHKQDLIWDEFRQVSEGTTRNFQGTGLGLSIVKKYSEILEAELNLKSEEGKGSTFLIKLKKSL